MESVQCLLGWGGEELPFASAHGFVCRSSQPPSERAGDSTGSAAGRQDVEGRVSIPSCSYQCAWQAAPHGAGVADRASGQLLPRLPSPHRSLPAACLRRGPVRHEGCLQPLFTLPFLLPVACKGSFPSSSVICPAHSTQLPRSQIAPDPCDAGCCELNTAGSGCSSGMVSAVVSTVVQGGGVEPRAGHRLPVPVLCPRPWGSARGFVEDFGRQGLSQV